MDILLGKYYYYYVRNCACLNLFKIRHLLRCLATFAYQATVYAAGWLVVDVRKVVRRTFNFTPRNPRGCIGLTANRLAEIHG